MGEITDPLPKKKCLCIQISLQRKSSLKKEETTLKWNLLLQDHSNLQGKIIHLVCVQTAKDWWLTAEPIALTHSPHQRHLNWSSLHNPPWEIKVEQTCCSVDVQTSVLRSATDKSKTFTGNFPPARSRPCSISENDSSIWKWLQQLTSKRKHIKLLGSGPAKKADQPWSRVHGHSLGCLRHFACCLFCQVKGW